MNEKYGIMTIVFLICGLYFKLNTSLFDTIMQIFCVIFTMICFTIFWFFDKEVI